LLIHGTGASTHTWREMLPLLADSFDVLAVDLPGHGFTGRLPGDSMALPDLADGLSDLLDTLGYRAVHAVGHSAGAAVLLEMTLDHLIDPACVVGINAALEPFGGTLQRFFSPLAKLLSLSDAAPRLLAGRARDVTAVRRMLAGTGSQLDARGIELYQRLLTEPSRVAATLRMMADWDLEPLNRRLPTLGQTLCLVASAGDRAVPARQASALAARVPLARVTGLEEGGHLVHEEYPVRVAELVGGLCRACTKDENNGEKSSGEQ
jgi:magnesium chelatase accessory protein